MLCKFNVTLVIVLIPIHNVLTIIDNKISGIVGKYMQKIIDVPGDLNRCRLVGVDEMGKTYKNGSSDGALNLLVQKVFINLDLLKNR